MVRSTVLLLALAPAALAGSALPATAQAVGTALCHDHRELVEALADRYREEPVSIGLQTDGHLIEVFASGETGTWTILATNPDGRSCILSAGKHFEQIPLRTPGAEANLAPPAPRG